MRKVGCRANGRRLLEHDDDHDDDDEHDHDTQPADESVQRQVRLAVVAGIAILESNFEHVRDFDDEHDEHDKHDDDFDFDDCEPVRTNRHDDDFDDHDCRRRHDDDDDDFDDKHARMLVPVSHRLRLCRQRLRDDVLHRQRQQRTDYRFVHVDDFDDDFHDDDVRLQHDDDFHDDDA